jgi:hypothetical protein
MQSSFGVGFIDNAEDQPRLWLSSRFTNEDLPTRTMDARIFYFYLALSIFEAASSGETAEKSA